MQKTKRTLAILLVAALIVMQLPMMALAAGTGEGGEINAFNILPDEMANQTVSSVSTTPTSIAAPERPALNSTPVCIVNDEDFTDSDSAIQSAFSNGGTLKLLENINYNAPIELGIGGVSGGNRSLMVDLNGYTLTINGALKINSSSILELEGEKRGVSEFNVNNTGPQPAVTLGTSAQAKVSNITSSNHYGIYFYGYSNALNVSGDVQSIHTGVWIDNPYNTLYIGGDITVSEADFGIDAGVMGNKDNKITIDGDIRISSSDNNRIVGIRATDNPNTKINGGIYMQAPGEKIAIIMVSDAYSYILGQGTYNSTTGYFDYTVNQYFPDSKIQIKGHQLTVASDIGGTVNAEASGPYEGGRLINLSATSVGSRSTFSHWTTSGDGTFADSTAAPTTFIMPSEDTTVTANFTLDNSLPTRLDIVPATVSTSVTYGETYMLDLSDIFTDADEDTLNYKVSLNGTGAVDIPSVIYSYTPTKTGTTTHKFLAYDDYNGYTDDNNRYLVTLTTEKKTPTISDLDYNLTAKTYNGLAQPVTVAAAEGISGLGEITVKYNGSTDEPKNAGTYAVTVSIAESENYDSADIPLGDYIIDKAELSITGIDAKIYDGTKDASGLALIFSGLQNGESLALGSDYTVSSAQFDSAEAGDNKTLTAMVVLEGTALAGNYILTGTSLNLTNQTISKATTSGNNQTLEAYKNYAHDYDFDLTTILPTLGSPSSFGTVTYEIREKVDSGSILGTINYAPGDTLTIPVNLVDAANKTATITVTVKSTNYTDFNATITVKTIDTISLTVTGLTVNTKTYDGSTAVTLSGSAALNTINVQVGDDVTLSGSPTATFDTANAGTNKNVTIAGLSLTGKDAPKYCLDLSGITGEIMAKQLAYSMVTLSSSYFTYTGSACTPDVTVKEGITTLVKGTDYTLTYNDNINIGTKIVTVTGMRNYSGTLEKAFTIDRKPITIIPDSNQSKIFGEVEPTLNYIASPELNSGDEFLGTLSRVQGDDAGEYEINLGTLSASMNYKLSLPATPVNFSITKKPITITPLSGQSKVYDASDPTMEFTNNGGLDTSAFIGALSREAGENVGSYVMNLGNLSAGDNYELSLAMGTVNFTIEQAKGESIGTSVSDVNKTAYEMRNAKNTQAVIDAVGLPETVSITTDNGTSNTYIMPITWSTITSYNPKGATYKVTGTLTGNANIDVESVTENVTVTVTPIEAENPVFGDTTVFVNAYGGLAATSALEADNILRKGGSIPVQGEEISYDISWNNLTLDTTPSSLGKNTLFTGTVSYPGAPVWLTLPEELTVSRRVGVTAKPTVTISGITTPNKTYDGAAYMYSGAINVSGDSVPVEQLEWLYESTDGGGYSGTAAPTDAGAYKLIISVPNSNANYTGSEVFTFTIEKRQITLTADDKTVIKGGALPELNYIVSNLAPEKTKADALSDEPTLACSTFDSNTEGSYAITLTGGTSTDNYIITIRTNGTLTVRPRSSGGGSGSGSSSGRDVTTTTPEENPDQHDEGNTAPSEKHIDITNHWAKESIDYVVSRGLFRGTSDTEFSPDMTMDRGMLVMVLSRLSGADVSAYKTSSFSDVETGNYYLPNVEWAYKNGVISGIGGGMFSPERAVTREEIALILYNYAKATGYKLPVTREATTYADASNIGSVYSAAVTAMQQAGIMVGDSDNKFNPKVGATRAEVAAMLHRYIKSAVS